MSARDTGTGDVLEAMILPALQRGGYTFRKRVDVGLRPGGGRHIADVVAEQQGRRWLVSLKWQQVSGTAEEKVPFEVICLAQALHTGGYQGAYLVLGGEGWRRRAFYTEGGLQKHLVHADKVKILTLERIVGEANRGRL